MPAAKKAATATKAKPRKPASKAAPKKKNKELVADDDEVSLQLVDAASEYLSGSY